jgi:S-methylmethionine-dependent homocysteine/selenocysteine methylase
MLESATWRASPDWAARLGYSDADLARTNEAAIAHLQGLRNRYGITDTVISGAIGPRGDGYRADTIQSPDEAAGYHSAQIGAMAAADMVTAYTLNYTAEAIGVVLAARAHNLPVAISFTVETDGRLPDGTPLAQAIQETDEAAAPDYFLVNCAHPVHIGRALTEGAWLRRIHGLRVNASQLSHAELDEAEELDEGDPAALAADHRALEALLPNLSIRGGCCGTDSRHVAALWGV